MPLVTTIGVLLLTGAAWQAAPAAPDVCRLLDETDIRAVQQVPLKETKSSDLQSKALRYQQCVFAATDFAHSVSVTLISGTPDATRSFWNETFRPQRTDVALARATRKKDLPRGVTGVGDDAFWTGDTRTGALYVRSGDQVLRISVGGASSDADRLERSHALAERALRRLRDRR